MNLARELAYNKKGNIQFFRVECLPVILQQTFNSFELINISCSKRIFFTTIKMIRRNNNVFKNFYDKGSFFHYIKPPLYEY